VFFEVFRYYVYSTGDLHIIYNSGIIKDRIGSQLTTRNCSFHIRDKRNVLENLHYDEPRIDADTEYQEEHCRLHDIVDLAMVSPEESF